MAELVSHPGKRGAFSQAKDVNRSWLGDYQHEMKNDCRLIWISVMSIRPNPLGKMSTCDFVSEDM